MSSVLVQEAPPVRSRVSFGAIIGGAVVALAVYLLLSLLGVALELSVTRHSTDTQLGVYAGVWAVATLLISLFCGGFVVSQCSVGETGGEAAVHGIIMWGVVFAFLLWLTTTGVSLGFNGVMSAATAANVAQGTGAPSDGESARVAAKRDGETDAAYQQRLSDEAKDAGAKVRNAASDPRAISAAWWTFAGVLFSMLAAMLGAVCGSGPHTVVAGFPVRSRFTLPGRRAVVVNR